jgi:regulator of sigma E protease
MGIITALLVLSLLVFLHELGHFLAARMMGVRVEVFSIGFGRKLFTKQIGDTEWSFSAIPLGGYVRMKGQDDSDPTKISYDEDSYSTKKPWQRIFILLAGPFGNFLTAFILFFAIANIGVIKLLPQVGEVGKDTPAFEAGIQKEDIIAQVNGVTIKYWNEISEHITTNSGDISLTLIRENRYIDLLLTPKMIEDQNIFGENITRPIIGIKPLGSRTTVQYGFFDSLTYAWNETINASLMIVKGIEKLITGVVGADKLGGVISIVDITAKASEAGIVALFFFTAMISVNLGVLNLLPIPALDGGHIIFNLYEWLRGKAPSDVAMYYITVAGWGILISLMMLGLYNDINRLMG